MPAVPLNTFLSVAACRQGIKRKVWLLELVHVLPAALKGQELAWTIADPEQMQNCHDFCLCKRKTMPRIAEPWGKQKSIHDSVRLSLHLRTPLLISDLLIAEHGCLEIRKSCMPDGRRLTQVLRNFLQGVLLCLLCRLFSGWQLMAGHK